MSLDDLEAEGCYCSATFPPCGWCENAPDPDSEEGLRRELREVRNELGRERAISKMLRESPPPPQHAHEIARLKAALFTEQTNAELSAVRIAKVSSLATALACVVMIAGERTSKIEGSRFAWLEVD